MPAWGAPRYHIIDDYLPFKPTREEARRVLGQDLVLTPFWFLLHLPLAHPSSAVRNQSHLFAPLLGTDDTPQAVSASASASLGDGVRLRGKPRVILDVENMTVSSSKESPLTQLSAVLRRSDTNYFAELLPGDWVLCWMLQDEARGRRVVQDVLAGRPGNGFLDGLKFVGRVQDPGRQRRQSPSGEVSVRYGLQAVGFGELQAQVFYDPYLAEAQQMMGSWLAKLGHGITELLGVPDRSDTTGIAAISINKAVPMFFDLLLGSGVPPRYANPSGERVLQVATGLTADGSAEAPYAYIVPEQVGQVLGKKARAKTPGVMAYADLAEMVTGVQNYSGASSGDGSAPWAAFVPDGVQFRTGLDAALGEPTRHKSTGVDMLGEFIPTPPDFCNKPVWSVLQQFLNPVVNEMYTRLGPNEAGQVVPQVVVRQIPLTSEPASRALRAMDPPLPHTRFLELPRWVIHPALVQADDTARSDSMRFNFIHISGQAPMSQRNNSQTYQLVRNPPLRDDEDIARNGLRPYVTTVACSLQDAVLGPRQWMQLAGDWLMGGHLHVSGTLQTIGIQHPICHGDNVEFDQCVLHIEHVRHNCSLSPDGRRSFNTTLALTHGLRSEGDPAYVPVDGDDSYMYYGLRPGDDPGTAAAAVIDAP